MSYKVAIDMITFTSIHKGGKDEVAYNLLRGFEEIGVSNEIICFCFEDLADIIRKVAPSIGVNVIKKVSSHRRINFWYAWDCERRYVKKKGIKILLFTNKPSSIRKFPIPTIEIPHDIAIFESGILPGLHENTKIRKKLIKKIIHDFKIRDYIISISDFDKQEMIKFIPWAENKIHRIYNPIRFEEYSLERNIKKEYITVLNIQWRHKNVVTVLKAFELISKKISLKLMLVGKFPDNIDELKEFVVAHDLESKVFFTGFVTQDVLNNIIAKTRIYINASYFEGFGMTAVEMMGKGIPTIVSKSTAMPEVTCGLCRYFEPADNYKDLAAKILDEISHPTSNEQLKDISEKMKNKYSYIKISKEYWEFFEKCIKSENED